MQRSEELTRTLSAVDALVKKTEQMTWHLESKKKYLAVKEASLDKAKARQALLDKVKAVLSHLLECTSKKDLRGMDSLVTYGLSTVYPEKGLEFKSEVVDTGKKISVEMSTYREGRKASKDQHGSVSVLESLVIRILAILKMKSARLLIADEPFSAVGDDHIGNVGTLLEELTKKLGMDILLITHNPGVADSCMFRVTLDPGNQLKLKKVGGPEKVGKVENLESHEASPETVAPVAKAKTKARAKPKKGES